MTDHNRGQTGGHSHCMKDKKEKKKEMFESEVVGKSSPVEPLCPLLQENLELTQVILLDPSPSRMVS